jgi:hypothetical protein
VVSNANILIEDFVAALNAYWVFSWSSKDTAHLCFSPSRSTPIILGKCGVYVFSMMAANTSKVGPNRTVKIDKISVGSGPRFRYQHYKAGSANSTLLAPSKTIKSCGTTWAFPSAPPISDSGFSSIPIGTLLS